MAKKGSNYRGGENYRQLNSARRMAKTSPDHRKPKSPLGYETIPHPRGAAWDSRSRAVIGHMPDCWLCGQMITDPKDAVPDHLIPLSEGADLSISTADLAHPLNQQANLMPAHRHTCNLWRGSLGIEAGRRRVAERLGMTQPYNGPVKDLTAVRAALDELIRTTTVKPVPKPAESPSAPYKSIAEAVADLSPLAGGDLADIWNWAGELDCDCGPADGSRCLLCLPVK